MSTPTPLKSFLRQWGSLIAFGVVAMAALPAFRHWTEHQEAQPVIAEYDGYLKYLAEGSPQARAYLDGYFKKYNPRFVESRDFKYVCAAMTRLAEADGVNPERHSLHMAAGCRSFARAVPVSDVP